MNADLRTTYLGMELSSPLVVSACPLTERVDRLKKMEAFGAAAVVLPSLFEEQIDALEMDLHHLHEDAANSFAEAMSYLPELSDYNIGPKGYLERVAAAKASVSIPVIASLNGATAGGWTRYAKQIEEAGADALELNIYSIPVDPAIDSSAVEGVYVELVAQVRSAVSIPLAVKVSPFFSAMANMATRLVDAGADGLVLFNRFLHTDIDLDEMRVVPRLALSEPYEARLPLAWIAILRDQIDRSLAATRGVHEAEDVVKLLAVGADVTMTTSALYKHGIEHLTTMRDGLQVWLDEHEYESVSQLKGSLSRENVPDPGAFERLNYMRALSSFGSGRV